MRLSLLFVFIFIGASCTQLPKQPAPVEEKKPMILESNQESLIETIPLLKPAAQQMFDQALLYEHENSQQAISYLIKANQIQPKAPQVSQKLAEIYLKQGDYKKSFKWSRLSALNGPSKGKVCEKSWTILALSAEQLGEFPTMENALEKTSQCIEKQPKRY